MSGPVTCDHADLERFAAAVLAALGTPAPEAEFMAGVIVASDLAGHESHGLRRLPEYVARARDGHADPAARPVADLDTGSLVRLDGRRGWGHVVVRDATDLAVERARRYGIAAVGIHSGEAAGRYADYCERAAAQGIAVLFFVNDGGGGQDVAPPGRLEPRLSTNPIAAGVPRAGSPHLVVDLSTSVVAAGRLAEQRDRGEPVPAEWVTSTGALRPVGGFKGFALALVAEALAGALAGAGTVRPGPVPDSQGVFLVAIDVAQLRPLDDFTAELERFLGYVLDGPGEPGAPPLHVPGAAGATVAAARRRDGVPVQTHTWVRMAALAAELDLPLPAPLP
jgi:hydroxycarboxylate dehydrogenase B